jgi:hypothetical protein
MWMLGCAAGTPLLLGADTATAGERVDLLRSLIVDREVARRFGRAYRAQYPAESTAAVLTPLVWRDLGGDETGGLVESAATLRQVLLRSLESRLRAQFGDGDTVQLHGWVVARTEARLCALCD